MCGIQWHSQLAIQYVSHIDKDKDTLVFGWI